MVTCTLEPEQQGSDPRLTQVDPECPQQLTQGLPQMSAAGCYWHRAREQPVCRNFTSRIVFKPGTNSVPKRRYIGHTQQMHF